MLSIKIKAEALVAKDLPERVKILTLTKEKKCLQESLKV